MNKKKNKHFSNEKDNFSEGRKYSFEYKQGRTIIQVNSHFGVENIKDRIEQIVLRQVCESIQQSQIHKNLFESTVS